MADVIATENTADASQSEMTAAETALMAEMEAADHEDAALAGGGDGDGGAPLAPKADTAADAAAGGKDGKKDDAGKEKYVPYGALAEERGERKKLEALLAAEKEERIKLNERTELLLKKFMGPTPEEKAAEAAAAEDAKPLPDFETDPAGHIAEIMRRTGKTLAQVEQELTTLKTEKANEKKAAEQRTALSAEMNEAVEAEKAFMAKTPDYLPASDFLLQSRIDELKEMDWTDAQIMQVLNNERLAIARRAKETGKNPAEIVYKLAVKRGYKKADVAADDKGGKADDADIKAAAERLKKAGQGREISQSLSDVGGKGPRVLTAEMLAKMPDSEFAKIMNTPEVKALMGA